jgi:HK97 family phage prohead protease/HK97 family phage major capsid protein
MVHRAYALLELKAVDDEQRIIEGIATTPVPDRSGDVVVPEGAQFTLPLPLLWQHRSDQPIGQVLEAKVTKSGIAIRAQIAKNLLPRIDEAWALIKSGLVAGLSIGFKPLESARIGDTFAEKFLSWEWLELSAVTIPANADASIRTIKECDAEHLAASGTGDRPVVSRSAGVTAVVRKDKKPMKTIQEQIKDFEATRAAKVAEREGIQTKAAGEGRTKDESERQAFDTLTTEIKSIDAELKDLRALEDENKSAAVAIEAKNLDDASRARAGHRPAISVRINREKGAGLARVVIANTAAFLQQGRVSASDVAKSFFPDDVEVHRAVKGAVGAGTSLDANFAADLVYYQNLANEFIEFLRPMTILGKFGTGNIPSLRKVPFNVRMVGQTSGGTGYWVGQAKPKPLTKFNFAQTTLTWAKVAAIAVIAQELAKFATPGAEGLVRDALAGALAERTDTDLVDPAVAAVANVSPASLTHGVAALSTAGVDADDVRADISALIRQFVLANISPASVVLIMPNTLALAAGLMRNALGQREFPDINVNGGVIEGLPVIASQYAANSGQYGNLVVAVNAPEVFLSDDGQVTVDASTQASLEMSDAPTQNGQAGTGADLVSLWQNNLIGLRAERFINWAKRRPEAVAFMDDVNWGSVGSPA